VSATRLIKRLFKASVSVSIMPPGGTPGQAPEPSFGRFAKARCSLAVALSSYALMGTLTLPLISSSAHATPAGDVAAASRNAAHHR